MSGPCDQSLGVRNDIEIGKLEQKLRHGNTIWTDEELQLLTFHAPMKTKIFQIKFGQTPTGRFCVLSTAD